jgi:hypothetical protein
VAARYLKKEPRAELGDDFGILTLGYLEKEARLHEKLCR